MMIHVSKYLCDHFVICLDYYINNLVDLPSHNYDILNHPRVLLPEVTQPDVIALKEELMNIVNSFKFMHVSGKHYHYQGNFIFLVYKHFDQQFKTGAKPSQLATNFASWYNLWKSSAQFNSHFYKEHPNHHFWISHIEASSRGDINIILSTSFLVSQGHQLLIQQIKPTPVKNLVKKETIVVDFSSPNIAKRMHVGHLRSTIIGDVISRFFEFLGHDVKRINHLGDWGRPFGIVIAYLNKYPHLLTSDLDDDQLQEIYVKGTELFKTDATFEQAVYQTTAGLQQKDPAIYEMWQKICRISRQAYQKVYDAFNIQLEDVGESFYQNQMVEMLQDLSDRKQLTSVAGMEVIKVSGYTNPFILRKSTQMGGNFTYDTTDLAALKYRLQDMKADRVYYVVDSGQANHFELLFHVARQVGYLKNQDVRHVNFGFVLTPSGKKISSRKTDQGLPVDQAPKTGLFDIISDGYDMSLRRTQETNLKRSQELTLTPSEIVEVATILNHNCLKYFDLIHQRVSNYKLNYDLMLSHKGNTAVYINYTYARLSKIVDTFQINYPDVDLDELHQRAIFEKNYLQEIKPQEITIYQILLSFPELLDRMEETLMPSYVTDYLYNLASAVSSFYNRSDCYCLVNNNEGGKKVVYYNRIVLVKLCLQRMDDLFKILGFDVISKI